nr:hypothetical protein GCM10020093_077490 [Planobispora longispora]
MTVSVVVADDQELVRSGFAMIIDAQSDLTVVAEAGDGAEAVEAVRLHRPDVLLLDIRMPRMDGIEAARTVCAETDTKVIMLTTFDQDDYVYDALYAGASGFLLKDVRRDDLVHAVRVVAAGDSLLAPAVTRRLIDDMVRRRPLPPRPPWDWTCSPSASARRWSCWAAACPTRRSPWSWWSASTPSRRT